MKKINIPIILLTLCVIVFSSTKNHLLAQYQSKKVTIKTEDYKGEAEVCTNCTDVKAEPSKTYRWFLNGDVKESKGSFKGELLHGKLELYNDDEGKGNKELIFSGNYSAGLKDGKNNNYVFGNLETTETYEKGAIKSADFYDSIHVDRRIEYLSSDAAFRKIKISYFNKTNTTRIEAEGYQTANANTYSNFFNGKYKKFCSSKKDGKVTERLKEEGNYTKNRRFGDFKIYYENGVVGISTYEKGIKISEKFTKDDKPYTGIAEDFDPRQLRMDEKIEIKSGLRDGKTESSPEGIRNKETKKLVYTFKKTVIYKAGVAEGNSSLNDFLKTQKIVSEVEFCKQCDDRGNGLFIDRIQYTADNNAIVYLQFHNIELVAGSNVYTPPPGDKEGFKAIDNKTKKVFAAKNIFGIEVDPYKDNLEYGEMIFFAIVFEGMTADHTNISFIEGDAENPYSTDPKTGNQISSWGCYDLTTK